MFREGGRRGLSLDRDGSGTLQVISMEVTRSYREPCTPIQDDDLKSGGEAVAPAARVIGKFRGQARTGF